LLLRTSLRIVAVVWVALVAARAADEPVQPLPFSHKTHAGTMKLQCKMCHPSPDPGESMTIAPTKVCMQCHSAIKTDSPAIQKLAQYDSQGKAVPWVRIYAIPAWVEFSHRSHLEAKNTCEDCHGKVAEREALSREVNLNMGTCMDCHAGKRAPTACNFCHEPR
jgi:hypothetical protein